MKTLSSLAIILFDEPETSENTAGDFQRSDIGINHFADIEKLLAALGADVSEGSGSRLAFMMGDHKLFVHRPHPSKEAKKYQVELVREFLISAGVEDE